MSNQYSIKPLIGRYGAELVCAVLGLVWPGNHNGLTLREHKIVIDGWSDKTLVEIKTGSDAFKIRIEQLELYQEIASWPETEVVYAFLSRRPAKFSPASLERGELESIVARSLWRMMVVDHSLLVAMLNTKWAKARHYPNSNWKSVLIINHGNTGLGAFTTDPIAVLRQLSLDPADYQIWQGRYQDLVFQEKVHSFQITQILRKGKKPFPRQTFAVQTKNPVLATLRDNQWVFEL